MFVRCEFVLGISADAACARLANLISSGVVDAVSKTAYREHGVAMMSVGPVPGVSRLVSVRLREPVSRGDACMIAMRWEVAGSGSSLFPVLDADLTVSPGGDGGTVLKLDGTYRPPLGTVGVVLDRAVLHHVASATARTFLHHIGGRITEPRQSAASEITGDMPPPIGIQPDMPTC